ncbi:MAG: hypothetical protein R3B06_11300 [Kofleriaceae bacterium]
MVDGRTLLAWADTDERRRRGGRPAGGWLVALAAGLALAGLVANHTRAWAADRVAPSATSLIAVALAALVPSMLLAPHRMFWRRDAAMIARMPLPGAALWWVALARATRAAAAGVLAATPTLLVTAAVDPALAGRAAALVAALAAASIGLVPAVCLAAATVVASGQAAATARALAGEAAVASTTLLGALPGAAMAGVVIAAATTGGWLADGDLRGLATVGGVALVAAIAAGLATRAAPRVYPLTMREVAALDRQVLAHLEIAPATAIEAAVRDRLGPARLVFDRMVRLVRRRYPLVALAGAASAVATIAIGWGRPDAADAWLAAVTAATAAVAAALAGAIRRDPIELPRSSATLPLAAGAVARAGRAVVATWVAVWGVVPAVIAIVASPSPGPTAAWMVGGGAVAAAVVLARRRPSAAA